MQPAASGAVAPSTAMRAAVLGDRQRSSGTSRVKGALARLLPLFLLVLMGLAGAAMAAPLVGAASLPEAPGRAAIPIAQDNLPNGGEVGETIAAGSYTYLQVVRDGSATWLAIPRREIAVGSQVRYGQGSLMKAFYSKSLDRTFDEVFFLGGVEVVGEASLAKPSEHPPIPASQESLPNRGEVSETIAAGNYTYLHVVRDGSATWLAIPRQEIAVGSQVRYGPGALMTAFYSASLDRTFDEVFFLGGVEVVEE